MATSISFINNTEGSHKDYLLNLFERADEIIFAVGFLKKGGLKNIKDYLKDFCDDKTKSSTFYIGIGLGETDPDALQSLFNILKRKPNHELIICTPDAGIFHPKIYVFIFDKKVTIVTGSSNLTQHGWVVNDEVSMIVETTTSSNEYLQLVKYFNQLHKKYFTNDIECLLKRYKKEIEDYKDAVGKARSFKFKRKETNMFRIDMFQLKRYYEIYKNSDDFIEPEKREEQYKLAKKNLEVLAGDVFLNNLQFRELFGPLVGHKDFKPKLWNSGSIQRRTHKTLNYPDAFREIVKIAKNNISQPLSIAFNNVINSLSQMRKAKSISGIGENIVTEILLSYNPKKFANLNANPLAVLSLVGHDFPRPSSFKGENYAEYVGLLAKVKNELNMSTFLEIDSFFNYVYWNFMDE